MQQSSATCKHKDVGIGLRKIVACSHSSSQCFPISTVFGMVSIPTSYFIFILVSLNFFSLDCSARRDDPYVRSTSVYVGACILCAGSKTEVVTFMCNQDKMASV